MKIGILGAGTVGGNLGKGLAAKGHEVMFSSREPGSPKMLALLADAPGARAGTVEETAAFGDVIVIALQWDALPAVVKGITDWTGKIVIDTTNRFGPAPADSIGASTQDIAHWTHAPVVKAFNTIGAEQFLNPVFNGQAATMFYCGDDQAAKNIVSSLIEDLGFEPVDIGGLGQSELLANLARLWVSLARGGFGRDIALKLLRR